MLKVTNNSSADLADRFDGVDYLFPRGQAVMVTNEAARHIFGFGTGDKTPHLVRLGWMIASHQHREAMQRLGEFTFTDVPDFDAQGNQNFQQDEQGLAPLQLGSDEEATADGVVESSVPIPADVLPPAAEAPAADMAIPKLGDEGAGRSILSQLFGSK